MVKASSSDILAILRRFNVATSDNVPRQILSIKTFNPIPVSTLFSFIFDKKMYFILFDDTADDNEEFLMDEFRTVKQDVTGELIENPIDSSKTYALPFRGKEVYLFALKSLKSRLDVVLSQKYPLVSRSTWQKYIKAGYVSVNSTLIDSVKQDVLETDDIAISLPVAETHDDSTLPIIYLDDNVIVIDKPAGILTHSKGVMNDEFTVADFFKRYCDYNQSTNRPGIVHRLDRDTSGVMIGARNQATATMLQKQFANRKTKKVYVAIVEGLPKSNKAIIDLPIGRNPSAPSKFRVDPKGKHAETKYEVIDSDDKYSLVKLEPKTGRTHQLRIHMQYINTPIRGDKVYGKPSERLYLHAKSLEVTIPGGVRRVFTSTVPKEFISIFKKAGEL